MTVIFSKKCEIAIQAILFLSTQPENKLNNVTIISEKLNVPKEFLAKILQTLTNYSIVGSKKGNSGGFYLNQSPENIKLIDIVSIIDGLDVFHKCVLGFSSCDSINPCPMHDKWEVIKKNIYDMLSNSTLQDLRDKTINKINSIYVDKKFDPNFIELNQKF